MKDMSYMQVSTPVCTMNRALTLSPTKGKKIELYQSLLLLILHSIPCLNTTPACLCASMGASFPGPVIVCL